MKPTGFILIVFLLLFSCQKSENKQITKDTTSSTEVEMHKTQHAVYQQDTIKSDTIDKQVIQNKEFTSKYICPNHCKGSGSDKPGYCPVCGMEYIQNPDYKADNE